MAAFDEDEDLTCALTMNVKCIDLRYSLFSGTGPPCPSFTYGLYASRSPMPFN